MASPSCVVLVAWLGSWDCRLGALQGWAPAVAGLGAHGCRVGRLRLQVWDTLIIVLIVVSSICLAIDSPRLAAAAAAGSPFEVQVSWWLDIRLQHSRHTVTAFMAYGYSLHGIRLQPLTASPSRCR